MIHHPISQYLVIMLASIACLSLSSAHAQTVITEMTVPTPLNGVLDADIYRGANDRLHIAGTAVRIAPQGYWDGFRLPFLMSRDTSGTTSTTFFPDTAWYWNDGLHGEEYRFVRSIALDAQDNVILFWSKQHATQSDIPPYLRLAVPSGKCFKRTSGGQVSLFDMPRSGSPAVTVGPDNTTHFAWEAIRSVRSDSNCVAYSSHVFHRSLNSSGQLSTPQLVDTGFSPRVASKSPNLARILWFRGDSSTASVFSLRYRTISAGIPSPILTLKQTVYKPTNLSMGIDSTGVVHAGWFEARPTNQVRVFILRFDGAVTTIDSSREYFYWPGMLRLAVLPNGIVHAVWSAEGSSADTFYYANTRTMPPFSNVRTFFHPSFRFANAHALFIKSSGLPGSVLGDASRIRYLPDLESGTDSILVLLTGVFFRASNNPVTVDASDNVWVVYGKNPLNYYQLGLARFVDQTTGVEDGKATPSLFSLNQNFPNPFNPITTIRFEIAERSHVLITVSDILGREVSRPIDETRSPGAYTAQFDASHLSSGVYFYHLKASGFVGTKKMLLVR